MQDRYLFKAKRIKGQWVEGVFYIEPYTDRCYIIQWNSTGLGFNEFIEVDGETVCQCTGLKDKNGNLIWENDIVKHYNDEAHPESYCTGTVLWDENYAGFYRTSNEYGLSKPRISSDCIYEVVGNVFDNPEMLEVDHDGE